MMSRWHLPVAVVLVTSLIIPRAVAAQGPWTVSLRATMDPLPIGMCGAVWLTVMDPAVKDAPRRPNGVRISMADFDLTVTSPDGKSAAGMYNGATNFSVCGCQGAVVGTVATITATYPAQNVPPAQRVPGVSQQVSTTVPLGLAKGTFNPQGCAAVAAQTVAVAGSPMVPPVTLATPAPTPATPAAGPPAGSAISLPGSSIGTPGVAQKTVAQPGLTAGGAKATTPAAVATAIPDNPTGFFAKQTGPGQVQLSWQPVTGVSYYGVFGPGSTGGGVQVATDTASLTVTGVPPGIHQWLIGSYNTPGPASTAMSAFPRAQVIVSDLVLSGWVDLHTHPMVNLAFGGKLVHGGPDIGSLLPADASCNKGVRALSMAHALGDDRPSHGGWNLVNFPCGDNFRHLLGHEFQQANGALTTGSPANGFPNFDQWPKWNDITHQKMWFEWIRRARDGGLRVMVALATNNKTLGDAFSGPGDGPTDDKASADLQVSEIKMFVGRHTDFMEVALNAADVKRIAQAGKIAVVLGVEIDNIGNFNALPVAGLPAAAQQVLISNEIQRLYASGVRYVFPVHVMDNVFGGTAIYKNDFNTANLREAGYYWSIECANVSDNITHKYSGGADLLRDVGAFLKLGLDPLRHPGPPPACPGGQPGKSSGHRNARGLTPQGIIAVKEMMKRGMIVDIDHMSQNTADATLTLAESFGYPLVSGHTGIRGQAGSDAENSRTPLQMERLSKLHGMFGLGSDGSHSYAWARLYQTAMINMGYMGADTSKARYRVGAISFGTDLNGLVKGPPPGGGNRVKYNASFPISMSGGKTWDYNTDGVAHYGLLSDFVIDVGTAPSNGFRGAGGIPLSVAGTELVDSHLNRSANYFWQMWVQIEAQKGLVQ